ncbi:DUF3757 domain-containing protein [Legionella sp.]|uniref:DUF3757 domain-containing protein n=1 Tax=Legionella sp. TaxID=459 RepID=UPI003C9F0510
MFAIAGGVSYATHCPDAQTTSLQWGEVPSPWIVSPYSSQPQGDDNTRFIRANILVAGYGRGVTCTYQNSAGIYTIWWSVLTKIPSRMDYHWIDTLGGFVCTQGVEECQFSVAVSNNS